MSKSHKKILSFVCLMLIFIGIHLAIIISAPLSLFQRILEFVIFLVTFGLVFGLGYHTYKFSKCLNKYVQNYQLTPKKLAEVTGFSPYDFSYDNKGKIVFIGSRKKQKALLEKLSKTYLM